LMFFVAVHITTFVVAPRIYREDPCRVITSRN
jgi:hypothetical protein